MARKILVVEDELDVAKVILARLKANGFEVITASDGLEGLNKARDENPDLVILDIGLPSLNGYDVCRMLKFDEKYKMIPIIMLTARDQQSDRETGAQVNADAYFTKPFSHEALIDQVKRLLDEARR